MRIHVFPLPSITNILNPGVVSLLIVPCSALSRKIFMVNRTLFTLARYSEAENARCLARSQECEAANLVAPREPNSHDRNAKEFKLASSRRRLLFSATCMRPAPKQVRMLTLTLFMQQIYACTHVDLAGENSLKYIDITNQQRMLLVGELP